jgi:sulfate adenylyltransferase subunit 2
VSSLINLEAESIEIFREATAGASRPVMLYSIGKDSSVLLHLARKAFYPAALPFPLLHVDTTWKFRAMYAHRARVAAEPGIHMIVHRNEAGVAADINPFTHGSSYYTDVMKTEALKQALDDHRFDIIFGGARRDEETSRAKERICSFRSPGHTWDPKSQRPEFWSNYNTRIRPGETMRVFPMSNWTELDIWRYIAREQIPVVPLYFAELRPVVERDGRLIMVDDDRFPLQPGETPQTRRVRFRTLGCYPLSGAIDSDATTIEEIVAETTAAGSSERQGRLIDSDQPGSMEKKKREGYF